ncbi:MAG TPA: cyclopropane-fatty-acyl-phospholipid synthase family protein [Verrucomicrobiae bacterium]|nr:cyclopropane-fatty-acyl-phospholipid synthase family protein [Verrucomicrobiae bacterium]
MNDPRDEFKDNAGLDRIFSRDGFSPDLTLPRAGVSLGLRLLMYMFKGVRIGRLDVTLPNGEVRQFAGTEPGPHGVLHIKSNKLIGYVLKNGEVGFGEGYLDGLWDTPDLANLLAVMHVNEPHYKGPYEKNVFARFGGWIKHKLRANSKEGARANIEYHYDLGNEFYKMWLDDTLAYSSAMFLSPDQSLQEAQLEKFRLMYDRLQLTAEHHLLEIGSGWGGFAIYAAERSGCRVTSITLSKEQLAEAQVRAQAAGVDDRVKFELRDYRDVHETYDRVVSIEMYEAVGEEYWPAYFNAISRALKPGGRAAIQGITISPGLFPEYRVKRDFIQTYIFPGGMLCPPGLFQDQAIQAGLKPEDARFYAKDYADTLAHWHRNVLLARERIVKQFDERFLRLWRYYLGYCECGFRVGSVDLMQITLNKPA